MTYNQPLRTYSPQDSGNLTWTLINALSRHPSMRPYVFGLPKLKRARNRLVEPYRALF